MDSKGNCIEHATGCTCGHVKVEDMSFNERRAYMSAVIKQMVKIKREAKNPIKTTT